MEVRGATPPGSAGSWLEVSPIRLCTGELRELDRWDAREPNTAGYRNSLIKSTIYGDSFPPGKMLVRLSLNFRQVNSVAFAPADATGVQTAPGFRRPRHRKSFPPNSFGRGIRYRVSCCMTRRALFRCSLVRPFGEITDSRSAISLRFARRSISSSSSISSQLGFERRCAGKSFRPTLYLPKSVPILVHGLNLKRRMRKPSRGPALSGSKIGPSLVRRVGPPG